jgi:hypothetical protein
MLQAKYGDPVSLGQFPFQHGVTHAALNHAQALDYPAHSFTRLMMQLYFLANRNHVAY